MNRLIRTTPFKIIGRSTQMTYNPEANDARLRSWSQRLNALASSGPSKVYLAQLGALLNLYTRQIEDITKSIDWSEWKNKIVTEGLVDKVQANYEQQSKEQYDLDKIFNDVFSKDSKVLDDINSEMSFHTAVWLDNYTDYMFFLYDVNSISNPSDYNLVEYVDMHQGADVQGQALAQTNSIYPGVRDDINLMSYMSKQFAWGKKVITFYRHPSDNNAANKATKNAMGR